MITDKIFIGTEVEGPDNGIPTIFIPRNSSETINIYKLVEYAKKEQINRFYFGAGDKTGLSEVDLFLASVLVLAFDCKILIEITLDDLLDVELISKYNRKNIELILVIHNDLLDYPVQHIKFVNKTYLHWCKTDTWFRTSIHDTEYNNDKIIEL